jgi:predicted phosphohydrolase
MPFHWLTDLHLDHASPSVTDAFLDALRQQPVAPVILTGDLSLSERLVADLERLADAARAPIYHVLGNHDYYGASVGAVRDNVLDLAERRAEIQWLPPAGVVMLDAETALVGVDGWPDGRLGDPLRTPIVFNDDKLIAELAQQESRAGKVAVRQALADADARRLEVLLGRAVATTAHEIVIATHVPPFVEGLAPGSRIAGPDWHPLVVSVAVGEVIRRVADAHPERTFTVLAGHTHARHEATIRPNLTVRVKGARYGKPEM